MRHTAVIRSTIPRHEQREIMYSHLWKNYWKVKWIISLTWFNRKWWKKIYETPPGRILAAFSFKVMQKVRTIADPMELVMFDYLKHKHITYHIVTQY